MFTVFIAHKPSSRSPFTVINFHIYLLIGYLHPLVINLCKSFTEHLFICICTHLSTLIYHMCFAHYLSKTFELSYFSSKSIITKWPHAIIYLKVRFIAFYRIVLPFNSPEHIAHSWLYIFCMLFILSAIHSRTLAHVATVICWLYPTLNTFYLILSHLILSMERMAAKITRAQYITGSLLLKRFSAYVF